MMGRFRFRSLLAAFLAPGAFLAAEEAGEWSWKPLRRPAVPEPTEAEATGAIDRFMVAAQHERGLSLAPEADRRTLIRRLTFDLWGLPPSPAEVQAFVNDSDPASYHKLVERLLASPRYGERWARHWLDVVHYGESHGYDKDKPRPNAWPYRDYVIRSFNQDKPYTRFVKEQLAGDVLWPATADGIVATGFIAAGPWDLIGHAEVPEDKIDGKVARHLDRDDMVTATMNTFCSITVQCAQCHDHKLDPVTMRDYYALQAVFAALDRADREYDPDPGTARRRNDLTQRTKETEAALTALEARIEQAKTPDLLDLEKQIATLERDLASGEINGKARSERYGYHSTVAPHPDVVKWVQVDLGRDVPVDAIALFGADEYGFADFGFPHRFRVEGSRTGDFEEAVLLWDHSKADFPRPGPFPVVIDGGGQTLRYLRVTATRLWSRRRNGEPLTKDYIFAIGELAVLSSGTVQPIEKVTALDSIEALPRWGKADLVDGIYGRYALRDRAPEGIASLLAQDRSATRDSLRQLIARRDLALRQAAGEDLVRQERLQAELEQLRNEIAALPKPSQVYAGTVHTGSGTFKGRGHLDGKPREIFILNRGDVTQPGERVQPGTVPNLVPHAPSTFPLPADHQEGDRRVALAEWITHHENPLTWRSIVNRIWQYHFGRGIVETSNDFGPGGAPPTHPALLDWLAVEFRDGGGSIKDLHRLIVHSATYKQASTHHPVHAAIDGSNQFLWRQNRRRLEAEALRDSVLLMAGKLDLTMGGPSFRDFVIERPEHSPHYQYHKADPDDPATHRRSVYRFLVRSQPQPFMDTLDCADPSQLVDKRGETTTALQALAMLNNTFMVRMAEHFAERVQDEVDPVGTAFALCFSRPPTSEERELLQSFAGQHGLAATCRLLFNLNEFSFVD